MFPGTLHSYNGGYSGGYTSAKYDVGEFDCNNAWWACKDIYDNFVSYVGIVCQELSATSPRQYVR